MRLVTWNFGRRTAESPAAVELVRRIAGARPDVVCATEAHAGTLAGAGLAGGHLIEDVGARMKDDTDADRKVMLWSRTPWTEVVTWPELSLLGGAVSGVTTTPLGQVRIVGLCAPWHQAWLAGAEQRPLDFELNIAFFERLKDVLKNLHSERPVVVCGRFCQYLPLSRGNWTAHHAMMSALSHFGIVTRGEIAPADEPVTDHVALPPQLRAGEVASLDRFDANGEALADDFGVLVAVQAGGVAVFD